MFEAGRMYCDAGISGRNCSDQSAWRKSADTWTTAESDISATVCLSKSGWESAVWSCGYGAHADAGSHLLLGRAVDGKVFSVLVKSMLSAGFGFLLVVGIMEYGGYGCLIILAGLLPQWIFIRRRCFSMRTVRKDRAESWDGTAGRIGRGSWRKRGL